jgi:hypothetical protein
VLGLVTAVFTGAAGPAAADPTPTPTGSASAGTAAPPVSPSSTPGSSTLSAAPNAAPTETASPSPRPRPADQDTPSLSLTVTSTGGPQPGKFFEDLGSFAFSGLATGLADAGRIEIYRRTGTADWVEVSSATLVSDGYATTVPVTEAGTVTFAATSGGSPGSGDEIQSAPVTVTVADSTLTLDAPQASLDALQDPAITGSVNPARPGVEIHLDVARSGKYRLAATATTDTDGRFSVPFSYGHAHLATYTLRATYRAANRDRWEITGSRTIRRIAVIDAVVTDTTADEVARTYHKGCPVGVSGLSTIAMNFYGRDSLMHRGVLIVRSNLTTKIIRGFRKALDHRYPVAKMNNPNVYGGNDPRQMTANNTSGFNCRKVVGNPYRQSPHSYGIAIDVNTVQNPYRDVHGTWWPKNGRSYIHRTPRRKGMLTKNSYLTRSLKADHFFWGGRWSPGRDYQHFEYRG